MQLVKLACSSSKEESMKRTIVDISNLEMNDTLVAIKRVDGDV